MSWAQVWCLGFAGTLARLNSKCISKHRWMMLCRRPGFGRPIIVFSLEFDFGEVCEKLVMFVIRTLCVGIGSMSIPVGIDCGRSGKTGFVVDD